MSTNIQNLRDLRARVKILKARRAELEADFHEKTTNVTDKLKIPSMLYNKVINWVSSFGTGKPHTGKGEPDWMTNLFKVGLPMIVNRFLFPSSGVVMKAVMALISQRAAKSVNLDLFSGIFDKVKRWVNTPSTRRPRRPEMKDYGIPPDSETF